MGIYSTPATNVPTVDTVFKKKKEKQVRPDGGSMEISRAPIFQNHQAANTAQYGSILSRNTELAVLEPSELVLICRPGESRSFCRCLSKVSDYS